MQVSNWPGSFPFPIAVSQPPASFWARAFRSPFGTWAAHFGRRARCRVPARFVTVGLAGIAATALLGIIFALTLGGVISNPALLAIASQGVPVHAIAGLGGWLTFTAMGVSYRLLAMFMLAPELDGTSTRAAFCLGTAALTLLILGGVGAIWMDGNLDFVLIAAAPAICLCGALLEETTYLYRARKWWVIELNSRMALALRSRRSRRLWC